ncbi:MAG: M20/M25/M40 family metallo-hydrolase [Nitrospirae bacterium]|nr:M20/M25/M40 family metallo-hydrolase [Nitrospirota bacterium]
MPGNDLTGVFEYIDRNSSRYVEELQHLIRQPSISATGEGVLKCAETVKHSLQEAGIQARLLPTETYPVVYGELKSEKAAKTLLVYTHYDVQPPDPLEKWTAEPFGAEIREGKIIGRGSSDSKGNILAVIKAAEAFMRTSGHAPLNIRFISEGEEEIGSPHLASFVDKQKSLLMADGVFSLDGGVSFSDRIELKFGQRGFLAIELRARTAAVEIHSKYEGIAPSSAWRLLWALGILRSENGMVLVPGFYEGIERPSTADMEFVRRFCGSTLPKEKLLREWGIGDFRGNADPAQALGTVLFEPSANVSGLSSGYTGLGIKTVIPNEAIAKMDWMLVPHQDPDDVFNKIVNHLSQSGFSDIDVKKTAVTEPGKVPCDTDLAQACCRSAQEVYGTEPIMLPINPGYAKSGPWLANRLGIHSGVHNGISGPMPCNQHAPNEFIGIGHFIKGIKYCAAVMEYYSHIEENKRVT